MIFTAKNQHFKRSGRAINLDQAQYDIIDIENCLFENTAGIFIQAKPNCKITIKNNHAVNIKKTPTMDYAQFVQVSGCPPDGRLASVPISLEISGNLVVNQPGQCDVEDVINLIDVVGTKTAPLLVRNNTITGAYPLDTSAKSLLTYSGGGIICDRGVGFALIENNIVSETTNYGIAIAGGSNNQIIGNKVTAIHAVNVGIYIANQYPKDPFKNNTQSKNTVSWMTPKGRNDYWLPK